MGQSHLIKLGKGKLSNIFKFRRNFCSRKAYFTHSFAIDVVARRLLCDNESFLSAKLVRPLYAKKRVRLMHIPPRSPDLNPIESFWGWLRGELRRSDLKDLRPKSQSSKKPQYTQRVKEVLRTVKAQNVAKAKFRNLKRVCNEVVEKKGAMSRQRTK